MQCLSCKFENMPGMTQCCRCGAALEISAVVNVYPPRAGTWKKRIRRWIPYHRFQISVINFAMSAWRRISHSAEVPDIAVKMPSSEILRRMIIPGWPQFVLGQKLRGRTFLAAFIGLFVFAILFYGTPQGNTSLGLAIAVHLASVIDVCCSGTYSLRERLHTSAFFSIILILALYVPFFSGTSYFASPISIYLDCPPFFSGDTVVYSRASYLIDSPKVGDVVLYRVDLGRNIDLGNHRILLVNGEGFDRILATEGQTLELTGQKLLIDGTPSPWQPLGSLESAPDLKITVPTGYYCILPTVYRIPSVTSATSRLWQDVCLIPRERIYGRALLVNYPFSHWRVIR